MPLRKPTSKNTGDYDPDRITLSEYSKDLSSRTPAPGGGSASGYAGCLGVSLASMVINYTIGKKGYEPYFSELEKRLAESEKIRLELLSLTQEDVRAFLSGDIEKCLNVPLEICRSCLRGMELCSALPEKVNANLISDVLVAAKLLEAAFWAAAANVEVNLNSRDFPGDRQAIKNALSKDKERIMLLLRDTEERVGKITGR